MSARAWTAFAAVSILWGIPYLFIKVAVDDGVPPIFLAWVRVLMAAAVLLVLSQRAGVLRRCSETTGAGSCSTRSSRSACRFR
jgi:drug/metabolite transporter (DMT)-like permease